MQERVKKLSAEVKNLSLAESLELRHLVEQRIAALALKTLGTETLDSLDDAQNLSGAVSLASKAEML